MTKNLDIRLQAKSNGLYLWQIAQQIGISEVTLCRWLRFDLPEQRRNQIETAIKQLSEGGDQA